MPVSFMRFQKVKKTTNGGITIKTEPNFFVKVENNTELVEIHHNIPAVCHEALVGANADSEFQLQLNALNSEKAKLISDLLELKEDYDRVCGKLNGKEEELQAAEVALVEKNSKIDDLKSALKRSEQICDKLSRNAIFHVNKIVGHKQINGVWHFLIRWKNYGPESDTWEPAKNVLCKEIVVNYMKKNKLN